MNRRLGALLLVVALGAVGAWILFRAPTRTSGDEQAKKDTQAANGTGEVPSLAAVADDEHDDDEHVEESAEDRIAETLEIHPPSAEEAKTWSLDQLQKSKQLYEEFTRYPPFSRPYDESKLPMVEWNKLRPMGQEFAVDEEKRPLSVEVSLDRMYAAIGEPINVVVKAGRVENDVFVDASFDKVEARVEVINPQTAKYDTVYKIPLQQSGPTFTGSVVPSSLPALKQGNPEALITVEIHRGVFFKEVRMPFEYAVTPPFTVLGVAGDRLESGSLYVDLEVDVVHTYPTLIQAVLYDKAGTTPIAIYDDYFRPTKAGKQTATIMFFGKALREKNINGPYSLRAVHGVIQFIDTELPHQYWKRDDTPLLLTKQYYATQFSDADWDSPEKNEKIKQYDDLIEAGGI